MDSIDSTVWMNELYVSCGFRSCVCCDVVVVDMSVRKVSVDAMSTTVCFNDSISVVPESDRTAVGPSSMMKNTALLVPNQMMN